MQDTSINVDQKIFGKQVGHVKIRGLMDCSTEVEFTESVRKCVEEWEQNSVGEEFIDYFMVKCELIRSTMTAEVRSRHLTCIVNLNRSLSLSQCVDHIESLV